MGMIRQWSLCCTDQGQVASAHLDCLWDTLLSTWHHGLSHVWWHHVICHVWWLTLLGQHCGKHQRGL